eukprot:562766_1
MTNEKICWQWQNITRVCESIDEGEFIKTGNVVSIPALNNRVELMLFDGGSSIGECPIFLTQNTWPWTLRCASDTTYHTTAAEIFTSIVSHHKNVSRILIKLAAQRCQRYTKMKSNQVERSNTSQQQIDSRNSFCGLNYKKNNFHFRIDNPQDKNSLRIASFAFLNNEEDGEMKKQYLFQIRSLIHNDIDRNTATGRWRLLRLFVTRHRKLNKIINTRNEMKLKLSTQNSLLFAPSEMHSQQQQMHEHSQRNT